MRLEVTIEVVRVGGRWNLLRVMSNGELWYWVLSLKAVHMGFVWF
jgi:hypothetical protein